MPAIVSRAGRDVGPDVVEARRLRGDDLLVEGDLVAAAGAGVAGADADLRDRHADAVAGLERLLVAVRVARELDQADGLAGADVARRQERLGVVGVGGGQVGRLQAAGVAGLLVVRARAAREGGQVRLELRGDVVQPGRMLERKRVQAVNGDHPRRQRGRHVDRAGRGAVGGAVGQAVVLERHAEGALGLGGCAGEGLREHACAGRPEPAGVHVGGDLGAHGGRRAEEPVQDLLGEAGAAARVRRHLRQEARMRRSQHELHPHGRGGGGVPEQSRVRHRRQHRPGQRGRRRRRRGDRGEWWGGGADCHRARRNEQLEGRSHEGLRSIEDARRRIRQVCPKATSAAGHFTRTGGG